MNMIKGLEVLKLEKQIAKIENSRLSLKRELHALNTRRKIDYMYNTSTTIARCERIKMRIEGLEKTIRRKVERKNMYKNSLSYKLIAFFR